MSAGSSSEPPAIRQAKRSAAETKQAYLDAHEAEIQNGNDNDKRRIRLQARKAANAKYEEELVKAIYEGEAEKELLLALIQSAQEEAKNVREEMRKLEDQQNQN